MPKTAGPLLGRGPIADTRATIRDANVAFDMLDVNSDGVLSRDEFSVPS